MRATVLMVAAAAAGLSVAAASCGSDGNSASITVPRHRGQASIGPPSAAPATSAPASNGPPSNGPASNGPASNDRQKDAERAAAASRESATRLAFSPACGKIPATGTGSRRWMASVPVVTAASHNPLLTDLAHAADVAGLARTLNSESAVTLFAPDNSAFRALGRGNYNTLMASKAGLAKVLEYHVVTGRVTPAELAERKPLMTLAGLPVDPVKSRNVYKVDGVPVICGNLRAANATIYILNGVLNMSSAGFAPATAHRRT
jgi:uncharacterized surface protein with fasciclin (FAS1) repeats